MKRTIKKYLIAHKSNNGKPHMLREKGIAIVLAIAVLVFGGVALQTTYLQSYNNMGAVYSSVVTELANKDREALSLQTLTVNPLLEKAAQLKADDMVSKGYFAHQSPDGKEPWYWLGEAGYSYVYAGENLAVNFTDSEDVHEAWMNSPTHKANVLNTKFTEIGIATAQGMFNGKKTLFVVEMFGKPQTSNVAINAPITTPTVENTQKPVDVVRPISKPSLVTKKIVAGTSTSEKVSSFAFTENKEVTSIEEKENVPLVVSSVSSAKDEVKSFLGYLATNPNKLLIILYSFLAFFVVVPLVSYIGIEFKRHHTKHVVYGVLVLILLASGLAFYNVVFPGIVVVL